MKKWKKGSCGGRGEYKCIDFLIFNSKIILIILTNQKIEVFTDIKSMKVVSHTINKTINRQKLLDGKQIHTQIRKRQNKAPKEKI